MTPVQGGITIETAPVARAWHASLMSGCGRIGIDVAELAELAALPRFDGQELFGAAEHALPSSCRTMRSGIARESARRCSVGRGGASRAGRRQRPS